MNGVLFDAIRDRTMTMRWRMIFGVCAAILICNAGGSPLDLSAESVQAQESVRRQGLLKIRRVEIEGNRTIPTDAIARKIKIRPGQEVTSSQIRAEEEALLATRWFFDAKPIPREAEDGDGYVLVFHVRERPILRRIVYKGNKNIKTKQLEAITNLHEGGAYAVSLNRESAQAIEQYYFNKGYIHCKVTLEKGGNEDDREVIFNVDEGPKVIVTKIDFEGNEFCHSAWLQTKVVTSKRKFFLIGGKFDPATIADDIIALKEYYFSLGFFDVEISESVKETKDRSKVHITYTIDEGIRYKVGKVIFNGPQVISEDTFRDQLKLREGDDFNERDLNADIAMIKAAYGKLGRIFAVVDTGSKYYEKPGVMDLVYDINEDQPYVINKIIVKINGDYPTTKETTVLNRLLIKPGDLADPELLRRSKRRLEGSQLFVSGPGQPGQPPTLEIKQVNNEEVREATQEIIRAQYNDDPPARNPVLNNSPQGDPFGNSLSGPQADWVDSRALLDVEVGVTEAQTGRLMIGAGVNSDNGVVGSIVLDERNFDIMRPPSSWEDIWTGRAWRGAGQQFRLEAVPGSQLNRYLISWRDPYFMDQDVSFGVSGFYFDRNYEYWNETRIGGRVTFGWQFTREWSAAVAFRLEDVELFGASTPTPLSLQEAVGNNFLSTVRASVAHDTRDAAFLPSEGHYVELAYEQAFGDYNYPRFEAEASQYFKVGERPDGSGRQIVTLRGELGFTGEDTPIFEKFYAGGYQSFRGFRFRGVSPRENDVTIGGEFLALGTVEFMQPILADDSVQAVVFSDFGTVEENVTFQNFRATVGAGLRITVPALGPVPLALDWAVPVADEDFDRRRLFQFYFGVFN